MGILGERGGLGERVGWGYWERGEDRKTGREGRMGILGEGVG